MWEQVTSTEERRLLFIDGEDGTVACAIYNKAEAGLLPSLSKKDYRLKMVTRTFLQMKNLKAVRGYHKSSILGPLHFLGSLNQLHLYEYRIEFVIKEQDNMIPVIYRHPKGPKGPQELKEEVKLHQCPIGAVVSAQWLSGITADTTINNLFRQSGTLYIDTILPLVKLPLVDPAVEDRVDQPFTEQPIDDFRRVTYFFEPGYRHRQVTVGCGLFLEQHHFTQLIMPMNQDSTVTLARWINSDHLEIIALRIPFGMMLVVEPECIHGDTTLCGLYSMSMTSSHFEMATGDTVFLKHKQSFKNLDFEVDLEEKRNLFPEYYIIDQHRSNNKTFCCSTK
jgi:hypothetical protein